MFLMCLQQQHLIELIRGRKIIEALDFAQTHLAERGEENGEILSELEKTLALLAFEFPEKSPYGELLNPAQRQKVASELNAAVLKEERKEATPKLSSLIKLLFWSQSELKAKKVKFPQLVDVASGSFEDSKY